VIFWPPCPLGLFLGTWNSRLGAGTISVIGRAWIQYTEKKIWSQNYWTDTGLGLLFKQ